MKNFLCYSLVITALLYFVNAGYAAEQLYTTQPTVTPSLAVSGEWQVGVETIGLVNKDQLSSVDFSSRTDRPLTIEVWYPATPKKDATHASYTDRTRSGKKFDLQGIAYRDAPVAADKKSFPLIVMSHGYTGYRSIMFYLGEHLASHGYVVASIDHTDSRNSDIDFAANSGAGFTSTLLNRARDQQFVLDYFTKSRSAIAGIANTDQAAVIGYSMGGYGALNTVGGCYSFSEQGLAAFGMPAEVAAKLMPIFNSCAAGREQTDPRWKAMVALAPWGGEPGVHNLDSLKKISAATLFIAGENDDISGYEEGVKKLFENTKSGENYMLVFENARHNIGAHPAPAVAYGSDLDIGHYYEPSWKIETINRISKHMSLAFLNCHVKASKTACEMLPTRQDSTQLKGSDGKLSEAWPGFPERWASGLQFIRK